MPMSVPITASTLTKLKELMRMSNRSQSAIVDEAVDGLYRQVQVESWNRDNARLRQDSKAWAQILKERQPWDQTILDGIEGTDA
jgi:hypothetical protein